MHDKSNQQFFSRKIFASFSIFPLDNIEVVFAYRVKTIWKRTCLTWIRRKKSLRKQISASQLIPLIEIKAASDDEWSANAANSKHLKIAFWHASEFRFISTSSVRRRYRWVSWKCKKKEKTWQRWTRASIASESCREFCNLHRPDLRCLNVLQLPQ